MFLFLQSGPVILFEYPKCEHIFENNCTIDEVRHVISWDFFSWGNHVYQKALEWAKTVDELMKKHSSDNKILPLTFVIQLELMLCKTIMIINYLMLKNI